MRTTVIIERRGKGYVSSLYGPHSGHNRVRCGLTPDEAAAAATRLMIEHAQSNSEGGDLVAPFDVAGLVPDHLVKIK